jgi:hypothetical protein
MASATALLVMAHAWAVMAHQDESVEAIVSLIAVQHAQPGKKRHVWATPPFAPSVRLWSMPSSR